MAVTWTAPPITLSPPLQVLAVPEMIKLRRLFRAPLVLFRAPVPEITPASSTLPEGPLVVGEMVAN